jgi:ATP-binding cassette subfamily F protein 3
LGYFDQHLSGLSDDLPVMDAIRPPRRQFEQQQRRDLLARFGVAGDTALQPVGSLSGGERCRAALARLAAAEANFLVLDEPTNHLDLWARDALENALRQFDGTVLLVSHDRYFVNQVADHLLIVEPDRVRQIDGNYDTYQMLRSGAAEGAPAAEDKPPPRNDPPPKSRPKRRFAYRKLAEIEGEIFTREARIRDIEQLLADGQTHRDGDRVRQLLAEMAEEKDALGLLYEHWEEAAETNS